ncbi:hypothetical protein G7K_0131-t1 [Saitoella complicata NRRL Y-17804]|uniref:Uncharacterized protein n=1 Tax=Saitoella complicata (strain BCRC 22490 / CBS 7301 / JCM 7358 / NBRC 10748 / NRRL Y-17804) TaxID=698492 RepID=A0A0E9N919_SAICN|nr:hypothetical protein G7K_0131-t1 [Saitoella complicata NRRL Y-17804]
MRVDNLDTGKVVAEARTVANGTEQLRRELYKPEIDGRGFWGLQPASGCLARRSYCHSAPTYSPNVPDGMGEVPTGFRVDVEGYPYGDGHGSFKSSKELQTKI